MGSQLLFEKGALLIIYLDRLVFGEHHVIGAGGVDSRGTGSGTGGGKD
jgi:hypothetical protein